jgi:hypothetical protein
MGDGGWRHVQQRQMPNLPRHPKSGETTPRTDFEHIHVSRKRQVLKKNFVADRKVV